MEIFDSLGEEFRRWDQGDHPWEYLEITKNPEGEITGAQVTSDAQLASITGGIGQIFGSSIGRMLSPNNQLGQLVAGTVAGAIGQRLSLAIAEGSLSIDISQVSTNSAFGDFGLSLQTAAAGSIASFLTAEIGSALGLTGFGKQLFDAGVGSLAGGVAGQVATLMQQPGVTFGSAIAGIKWGTALTNAAQGVSGALGGILAHQLVPAQTQAGAIGGQLGGAIGSLVGASLVSTVASLALNIIVPGIGSLIGTIFGTVLGDLFGGDPERPPFSIDRIDPSGYGYSSQLYQRTANGNASVSHALSAVVEDIVEGYLTAVNGVALASSESISIGYDLGGNPNTPYAWGENIKVQGLDLETGVSYWAEQTTYRPPSTTAEAAVDAAAVELLHHTEVVGGDLLLKRAHQRSTYSSTLVLSGDLQAAQDYGRYLDNREVINALMAANPQSAFTGGWAATFARINDLHLNQYGASDFLGGMVTGYLDSVRKAGLAFDASNVSVKRGSNGSVTIEIHVDHGTDVPGVLSVFASQTNEIADATGKTIQLVFNDGLTAGGFHSPSASVESGFWKATGGTGNNIWFGRDDMANRFVPDAGSANIVVGGALNDELHGSGGGDFIDGAGGDDWITGSVAADILRGGDGDDTIVADAGNDALSGDAGDDGISGGTGDDTLRGGAGLDSLLGGLGNDTFVFARGDGDDRVFDDGGDDTLRFGAGIGLSQLMVQVRGNNLIIGVKDPANPGATFEQLTDKVTLHDWANPLNRVETFAFADGTTLKLATGGNVFATGLALSGGTVAEHTVAGVLVGTAAGQGLSAGAAVSYSLIDSASNRFAINATTGVITVANGLLLDYEKAGSHVVTVGMTDQYGTVISKNFTVALTNVDETPAAMTAGDFNGDGKADILGQNDAGLPLIALMNGADVISVSVLSDVGPTWHVKAAADFNGDGKADILWQDDGGQPSIWTMNGTQPVAYAALTNVGPNWHAEAAADFNGDGKADILLQHDNGQMAIWTMNGSQVSLYSSLPSNPGPTWHTAAAADFNGDGKADILLQNDNGQAAIWTMNGSQVSLYSSLPSNPGPTWHVEAAADFNGDGKADILWQSDNGQAAIWTMNGSQVSLYSSLSDVGPNWHVEAAADYSGDGKADILWRDDNGSAAIWTMNGGQVSLYSMLDGGSDWHLV